MPFSRPLVRPLARCSQVIFEAYRNKTITTTDWTSMDLESSVPSGLRSASVGTSELT